MVRPAGFKYFASLPIANGSLAVTGSTSAPITSPGTTDPSYVDYVVKTQLTGSTAASIINNSLRGAGNNYDDLALFYNNSGVLTPVDYLYDTWSNGAWSSTNVTLWHKLQAPIQNYATLYAKDSFNRTVSNGWGTADTGGSWSIAAGSGGTAASFSVAPSAGAISADVNIESQILSGVSAQDTEILCKIIPETAAPTDSTDQGVMLRWISSAGTNWWYQANAYGQSNVYRLDIKLKSTGSTSTNTILNENITSMSSVGNAPFWLRFKAVGTSPTTLSAKIWLDGTPEPANWTISGITDSTAALQAPGAVGCIAYDGTSTQTTKFANFVASSPSALGVYTSPDGTTNSGGYVLAWGSTASQAHRNPANIYPLWDDFPGSSLDGTKWNTQAAPNNPTIAVASSILTLSPNGASGDESIYSIGTFGSGYKAELRAAMPGVTAGYMVIEFRPGAGGTPYHHLYPIGGATAYQLVNNSGAGDSAAASVGTIDSSYHIFGLARNADGSSTGSVDAASANQAASPFNTAEPLRLMINTSSTANFSIDHVRVRPMISGTEPVATTLGTIRNVTVSRQSYSGGCIDLRGGF